MKKVKSWELLKDLYARFMIDDLLSREAQVTFFLLLSLFSFSHIFNSLIAYTPIVNFQDNIEFDVYAYKCI